MEEHILRIILASARWSECRSRVEQSYGTHTLRLAERLARQHRPEWFANEPGYSALDTSQHATERDAQPAANAPPTHGGLTRIEPTLEHNSKLTEPVQRPVRLRRGRFPIDVVLLSTAAAFAAAVLFPPFHASFESLTINLGYGFLFTPPQRGAAIGMVTVPLLTLELIVIAAAGMLIALVGRFE